METFHVALTQVAGGARLGKESSVLVSIAPNDSPLGSFGFEALTVNWPTVFFIHVDAFILPPPQPCLCVSVSLNSHNRKRIAEEYLEILS